MWLPWKIWTFRMIFPQSSLMILKITMYWSLTWLQCKTLLKFVTILNLLENHWDWNLILSNLLKRYWTHCIRWTIVVGCSWQVWCCWKECVKMDNIALQQSVNGILLLKFRYLGSFPSDYVPNLDNDNFAVINTQPSKIQGEHWILIANFRHELYFADSLGCKVYSFLNNNKQHYKQMMPAPLQSHPSVWGFYTRYAAFLLFKFPQEEITGVHDIIKLSFISNFM